MTEQANTEFTTAHAVTAQEGRDTRIVAAHTDLAEARRLMAATKRSEPDADYEVVPVPVVTHLPQVQPLHRCYADIGDDGEIHYDLVEQPHAFGFPCLNGYPAADDVRVEDVAGGDPSTTYILVDGWDRAKVWERIRAEAERIGAEKAGRPEPPAWACPKCRNSNVWVVLAPRRVAWGQGSKLGIVPAADDEEARRLRCEKCRNVYPIPAGVEIEGL
jgi:uncharacterized protein YbaR (Trm112 family)